MGKLNYKTAQVQALLDDVPEKEPGNPNIQAHIPSTGNPHSTSAGSVGLGNVDNTADADKPVSTQAQVELDNKEPAAASIQQTVSQVAAGKTTTLTQAEIDNLDASTWGNSLVQRDDGVLFKSTGTKFIVKPAKRDKASNLSNFKQIETMQLGSDVLADGADASAYYITQNPTQGTITSNHTETINGEIQSIKITANANQLINCDIAPYSSPLDMSNHDDFVIMAYIEDSTVAGSLIFLCV